VKGCTPIDPIELRDAPEGSIPPLGIMSDVSERASRRLWEGERWNCCAFRAKPFVYPMDTEEARDNCLALNRGGRPSESISHVFGARDKGWNEDDL
jgi:hypothetical protein